MQTLSAQLVRFHFALGFALRLVYTPGPEQTSIALPDNPAKDAITVVDPDTGPPEPEQVTNPLWFNVTNGCSAESVQFAEESTSVVPLLNVPTALS
jgi:hypothetical protein